MTPDKTDHRIFKNNLLERFSKTNAYFVIMAYFIISAGILIYGSLHTGTSFMLQISLFIAGLVLFSFVEYMVHRYLFHSGDPSKKSTLSYRLHHIHHDHPSDKKRLALPLPLGIAIAALIYGLFWLPLGSLTPFFFPGFITGYAMYLWIHYLIHTRRPPKNNFRILWRNHNIHHFGNDKKAFGVTSPLWDFIFNTNP